MSVQRGNLTDNISETMAAALEFLHRIWARAASPWLVGGSCGLLLQGVVLRTLPRDLDVYADQPNVADLHERLRAYAVDEPDWSETGIYRSFLSHYRIGGVPVELVGSLQVDAEGSSYTVEVGELLSAERNDLDVRGRTIPLMPLTHELLFNVLRNRPDRYEPIAEAMRRSWPRHEKLAHRLAERVRLSPEKAALLARLVPWPAEAGRSAQEEEAQ